MMFRNHLVVTTAVAVSVVKYMDIPLPLWVLLLAIYFGSLLPDLDHPGSTIGRRLLFISVPLSGIFGHRQITHSVWPFIITFWMFNNEHTQNQVVIACMIGYFSHILADILSDSGVPFFWPFQMRIGVKLCKSGGVLEHVIAYSLLVAAILY
jgi:inner membrane protein